VVVVIVVVAIVLQRSEDVLLRWFEIV